MTSMIIVVVVGISIMALITLWEEFFLYVDISVSDENLSAVREEDCTCRACNTRKEKAMYVDVVYEPNDFLAEVARSNGANSMQMVWAREMLSEVKGGK